MLSLHMLRPFAQDIWTLSHPHRFGGIPVGTRMTVMRNGQGEVILHSPVPLSPEVQQEIETLGPVKAIICPNRFHHLYAAAAKERFPKAALWGPRGLQQKRPDLLFTGLFDLTSPTTCCDLPVHLIAGSDAIQEVAVFHPASKTLVLADFIMHLGKRGNWLNRLFAKLEDCDQEPRTPRLFRLFSKKRDTRQSLEHLMTWPFERVMIAHGPPISENGREAFKRACAWILK